MYERKKRKHRAWNSMAHDIRELIDGVPENYSKPHLIPTMIDVVYCRLRYGAGIRDYFDYRFYSLNRIGRKSFITVGDMFSLYKNVNDVNFLSRTSNKNEFYKYYGQLMGRKAVSVADDTDDAVLSAFLKEAEENGIRRLILKPYNGGDGVGIFSLELHDAALSSVSSLMERYETEIQNTIRSSPNTAKKFEGRRELDVEWVIENHETIKKINPSSLNTLRIPALYENGTCKIIGAYIRFGRDGSLVDNIRSGGLAAYVDVDTGILIHPARDVPQNHYIYHPTTGEKIVGLQLPYWEETKALVAEAAAITPQLKYVGWDVAITPTGPVIIEGNSLGDACFLQNFSHEGIRYLFNGVLK